MHGEPPNHIGGVPLWMVADKVSFWEKTEVRLYQLISVFPVFVTFGLYTYLLIFYVGVSVPSCLNNEISCTSTHVLQEASSAL